MPNMTLEELQELPVTVNLVTAGRALGLGRTKCFELVRDGEFPVEVLKLGKAFRVRTADLRRYLGLVTS